MSLFKNKNKNIDIICQHHIDQEATLRNHFEKLTLLSIFLKLMLCPHPFYLSRFKYNLHIPLVFILLLLYLCLKPKVRKRNIGLILMGSRVLSIQHKIEGCKRN